MHDQTSSIFHFEMTPCVPNKVLISFFSDASEALNGLLNGSDKQDSCCTVAILVFTYHPSLHFVSPPKRPNVADEV